MNPIAAVIADRAATTSELRSFSYEDAYPIVDDEQLRYGRNLIKYRVSNANCGTSTARYIDTRRIALDRDPNYRRFTADLDAGSEVVLQDTTGYNAPCCLVNANGVIPALNRVVHKMAVGIVVAVDGIGIHVAVDRHSADRHACIIDYDDVAGTVRRIADRRAGASGNRQRTEILDYQIFVARTLHADRIWRVVAQAAQVLERRADTGELTFTPAIDLHRVRMRAGATDHKARDDEPAVAIDYPDPVILL